MMTSPTGNRAISANRAKGLWHWSTTGTAGFTLVELLLVMAMLSIVLAVAAPSLSRFFRGRTLDSEAKRLLAMTRYGQSRAISEGIPIILWVDAKQGAYGLQADSSYVERDDKKLEYEMGKDLTIEVDQSIPKRSQATLWKGTGGLAPNLARIRFAPDGFIAENNPEWIVLRQAKEGEVWITPSPNRLNYEIQTNQIPRLRR